MGMIKVIPSTYKNITVNQYDIYIAHIGYETRARSIAEKKMPSARHYSACAFPNRKTHDYERNQDFYRINGFEISEQNDETIKEYYRRVIEPVIENRKTVRICIDISSISRLWLARFIETVIQLSSTSNIMVDYAYAFAKYTPPSTNVEPIKVFSPITKYFSGWTDDPNMPLVMLVGLGYEYDRAIGFIEHLEPSEVWIYLPTGHNKKYETAILKSNEGLWDIIRQKNIIEYELFSPFHTFTRLESFIYGALESGRVTLAPFGPKIFCLLCLLVGSIHPKVSVWRVSADEYGDPINKLPSGKIVNLSVEYSAPE